MGSLDASGTSGDESMMVSEVAESFGGNPVLARRSSFYNESEESVIRDDQAYPFLEDNDALLKLLDASFFVPRTRSRRSRC